MTLDISALFLNGIGLTLLGYLAHRAVAGLDAKIQGQDKKLDQIIAGQSEFVRRGEHDKAVCRLHDKLEVLEASDADIKSRVGVLESRIFTSFFGKEGK